MPCHNCDCRSTPLVADDVIHAGLDGPLLLSLPPVAIERELGLGNYFGKRIRTNVRKLRNRIRVKPVSFKETRAADMRAIDSARLWFAGSPHVAIIYAMLRDNSLWDSIVTKGVRSTDGSNKEQSIFLFSLAQLVKWTTAVVAPQILVGYFVADSYVQFGRPVLALLAVIGATGQIVGGGVLARRFGVPVVLLCWLGWELIWSILQLVLFHLLWDILPWRWLDPLGQISFALASAILPATATLCWARFELRRLPPGSRPVITKQMIMVRSRMHHVFGFADWPSRFAKDRRECQSTCSRMHHRFLRMWRPNTLTLLPLHKTVDHECSSKQPRYED
eukprot:SAG31_NODE_1343_length_8700_cov_1.967911_2_plen_334_part_00